MAGKNITDKQLEALLNLYQPCHSPSQAYWKELEQKSEQEISKNKLQVKSQTKKPWILGLSGGLAAAAALVILILWPRTLDLPYEISGKSFHVSPGDSSWIGDPLKTLTLTTSGETLVLSPGAQLQVSSRKPELSMKPGNQYTLTQGKLELDHHNSQSTFVLVTPFGQISPLGTRLKIVVEKTYQDLICLEGEIEFTPEGGFPQLISPGEIHRWPPEIRVSTGTFSVTPEPQVVPKIDAPWELQKLWEVAITEPVVDLSVNTGRLWISTKQTLKALDLTSGKTVGTWPLGPDPWVANAGSVFSYRSGKLRAMDFQGQILWETPAPPVAFGGMSLFQGMIYLPSADGTLSLWSSDQGNQINTFSLGSGSYGVPLVVGDSVYISTLDRRFLSLERNTGKIQWAQDFDQRFVGDHPQVWGNLIFTGTKEGRILFLDRKNGDLLWSVETGLSSGQKVKLAGDSVFIKTSTGTQRYLPSGKPLPWSGEDVLAVGSINNLKGEKYMITAEPQGVWIQSPGERKLILALELDSASWTGESLVLKTLDGRLSLHKPVLEK